jgi:hypothetical protein
MNTNKTQSQMFTVINSATNYHQLTREFALESTDSERQLVNCERAVKTLASIRHAFINTNQSELVSMLDDYMTRLLEFNHWRVKYYLDKSEEELAFLQAQGYVYETKGSPAKVSVLVRNSALAKLIDIVQDVDKLLAIGAKTDISSLHTPSEQKAKRARVIGVIRDVNQYLMRLKSVLFDHYKLSSQKSDVKKLMATCNFPEIKIFFNVYCKEHRSYFELVQQMAGDGVDDELQRVSLSKHIDLNKIASEASRALKLNEPGTPRAADTLLLVPLKSPDTKKEKSNPEIHDVISHLFHEDTTS